MTRTRATEAARPSLPPSDAAALEEPALLFKALGHPTRLAIVNALADGERSVLALRSIVGFDLSTISRHLLQLKSAGVLASHREGKQVLYRLRTPCVLTVMRCVTTIVADEAPQVAASAGPPPHTPCGASCRPLLEHMPALTEHSAQTAG
jgi:ArsR family transcriptional regulator